MNELDENCPFCKLDGIDFIDRNRKVVAFFDQNPVNEGHILIVPVRHVSNYFDLSPKEQWAMLEMVNRCKIVLEEKFHPDGYNIGVNCGEAAGQSIAHAHIHMIPRYKGDIDNPKGGIRGAIPEKRIY